MDPSTIIGLLAALGVGGLISKLADLLIERWRGRLEARQRAAEAIADCTEAARRWEAAAWATHLAAVKHGINPDDLPDLDKET